MASRKTILLIIGGAVALMLGGAVTFLVLDARSPSLPYYLRAAECRDKPCL